MKTESLVLSLCSLFLACPGLLYAEETGQDEPTFGGPSGVSGEQCDSEDILDAFRVDNRKLIMYN